VVLEEIIVEGLSQQLQEIMEVMVAQAAEEEILEELEALVFLVKEIMVDLLELNGEAEAAAALVLLAVAQQLAKEDLVEMDFNLL
jgi:hypothetical protein